MYRKLTDAQITATYAALQAAGRPTSGRALRAELRLRYGASGKTGRVFALCRALRTPQQVVDPSLRVLNEQLAAAQRQQAGAERERDLAVARAERSELREISHQDRWANEIHQLRQTVTELQGERHRRQTLEEQVLRLQRELQVLQRRLARQED